MGNEEKSWLKGKRWLLPLTPPFLLAVIFFIYVSGYYHADETAQHFMLSDDSVSVTATDYGWLFDGSSEDTALIFYPGGKVEETAYAPLLHTLAAEGMDVCLVRMPFRLAILHGNAADAIINSHDYTNWYIGGHSLGGVMAASYASDHGDELSGVILLAAYPIKQIPDPMKEIQVIGSEDHVINQDKVKEGKAYASKYYTEHVIEGGNHAQFGSYGQQNGDGMATITPEEQIQETIQVILDAVRQ